MPSCLLSGSLSLSLSRYASPVSFLWNHLLFTRTLGLPSATALVPNWPRSAESGRGQCMTCSCVSVDWLSNFNNCPVPRGLYRDSERHSDICTLDTSQTVTPSVRCGCSQLCTYHRQFVLTSFRITHHINARTLLLPTLLYRSRRTTCCTSVEIHCQWWGSNNISYIFCVHSHYISAHKIW